MICRGCGNQAAHIVRTRYLEGIAEEVCNGCEGALHMGLSAADVYFPGQPYHDENIGDHKTSPGGEWITSKRHKAERLRALGLREAGDRKHGAR